MNWHFKLQTSGWREMSLHGDVLFIFYPRRLKFTDLLLYIYLRFLVSASFWYIFMNVHIFKFSARRPDVAVVNMSSIVFCVLLLFFAGLKFRISLHSVLSSIWTVNVLYSITIKLVMLKRDIWHDVLIFRDPDCHTGLCGRCLRGRCKSSGGQSGVFWLLWRLLSGFTRTT